MSTTTAVQLADSLKMLMQLSPFDQITVGMIAETARCNRTTFYKHFRDKYELLEYIYRQDIQSFLSLVREYGLLHERALGLSELLVELFFKTLEENRAFYLKAITVTGQNGFHDIMLSEAKTLLREDMGPGQGFLATDPVVTFYAAGLIAMTTDWLRGGMQKSAGELAAIFLKLMRNSYISLRDT